MAGRTLRLLTLNVWFDEKLRHARMQALSRLLWEQQPEVCCLQEVVPAVAVKLIRDLPGWTASDPGDGSTVAPYGVMILLPPGTPVRFSFHRLPTNMARQLLVAELDGLTVGTVHLESLANHRTRVAQLEMCAKVLAHFPDAILAGDFNFDSQRNFKPPHVPLENEALPRTLPDFTDLWPALRPERGLTFDSSINPYLRKPEHMRYDRIMARLPGWRAASIELVGDEPMEAPGLSAHELAELERPPTPPRPSHRPRQPPGFGSDAPDEEPRSPGAGGAETPPRPRGLFLSDHFGIMATLEQAECPGGEA